ncbi:MAG TPA: hypothetical protein PKA64_04595 [Myxococcota bacterium]|nr:hypothetical protein [Myxococcota bacterium]
MRALTSLVLLTPNLAAAQTLVLYTDHQPSAVELAAAAVGVRAQVFVGDPAAFLRAVTPTSYVAVDVLREWPNLQVEAAVQAAAANDQPVLYSSWGLNAVPATQAALGVQATEYTDALRHAATDEGPNLLGGFGGVLFPSSRFAAPIDGQYLDLTASGWFAARDVTTGGGTIAVTHGGHVIVNGLLAYDYQDIDRDLNGQSDAVDLFAAELGLLLGAAPQVTMEVAGACPGPLTISVRNLVPSRSFAVAVSDTIGRGTAPAAACAGAPLGLSTTSLSLLTTRSSGRGDVTWTVSPNPALCGRHVQIIDLASCDATNVVGPL